MVDECKYEWEYICKTWIRVRVYFQEYKHIKNIK